MTRMSLAEQTCSLAETALVAREELARGGQVCVPRPGQEVAVLTWWAAT